MTKPDKTSLTVNKTKMSAITVPVNVIFDELYTPPSFPAELIADRFQILEIDGYYLTIHECIYMDKVASKQEFRCFVSVNDAFSYLEMFGVVNPGKETEDSERDHDDG